MAYKDWDESQCIAFTVIAVFLGMTLIISSAIAVCSYFQQQTVQTAMKNGLAQKQIINGGFQQVIWTKDKTKE